MGIADVLGQLVFDDIPGLGIQLADVALGVRGKPQIAVPIEGEAVWTRRGRLGVILLELARLRIEPPEHVGEHPGPPDGTVRAWLRIVRSRSEGRYIPFPDVHVYGAGDDDWLGPRLFGEVLRQVVGNLGFVGGGERHHRAEELLPALSRESAGVRS